MSDTAPPSIGDFLQCCPDLTWTHDAGTWRCTGCGRTITATDGIHYLVATDQAHNVLEQMDYDDHHAVDLPHIQASGAAWAALIAANTARPPLRVLELGAGTGFLTLGLNLAVPARQIVSADISAPFLTRARQRVRDHGTDTARHHYFAGDIQDLPFRPGAFDIVVGNSILHHVMDYGAMLARCADLVAPGGIVVFNEPVLQGKLPLAFLLRIIAEMDAAGLNRLRPDQHLALHDVAYLWTIDKLIADRPDLRAAMEDKHLFDTAALAAAAPGWGYTHMTTANTRDIRGDARDHGDAMVRILGLDPRALDPYQFVFDAYQDVVLDLLGQHSATAHQYLIFHKAA